MLFRSDSAMWIDHGRIRQSGGIEEIVTAYEGPRAGKAIAEYMDRLNREG